MLQSMGSQRGGHDLETEQQMPQEGGRTNNKVPCLLIPGEGGEPTCSLYRVRVGVSPGVRPEWWLRWFAHPLGGIVCRGPAFAPGSSKVTVGWWCWFVFCFDFF